MDAATGFVEIGCGDAGRIAWLHAWYPIVEPPKRREERWKTAHAGGEA
jgi:hypothetical protein